MRYYEVWRDVYQLLTNLKTTLDATPTDREQIAKVFYWVVWKTNEYPTVAIYPWSTSFDTWSDLNKTTGIVNIPYTIKVLVENKFLQDPDWWALVGENYYDNQLRLLSDRIILELMSNTILSSCELTTIGVSPVNTDFDVPTMVFEITANYQQTFRLS